MRRGVRAANYQVALETHFVVVDTFAAGCPDTGTFTLHLKAE